MLSEEPSLHPLHGVLRRSPLPITLRGAASQATPVLPGDQHSRQGARQLHSPSTEAGAVGSSQRGTNSPTPSSRQAAWRGLRWKCRQSAHGIICPPHPPPHSSLLCLHSWFWKLLMPGKILSDTLAISPPHSLQSMKSHHWCLCLAWGYVFFQSTVYTLSH